LVKTRSKLKTIIIILGAARSGSTLLAKTIGGHSSCFTLGEINRFNQEINNPETHCGCGNKLNQCDFWIQTLKDLKLKFGAPEKESTNDFNVGIFKQLTQKNKLHKLVTTILFKNKYYNEHVETEIENTFTLYKKMFERTNSNVLIDSTKGLFRALVLESRSSTNNMEFKFVQLIRDGRGVLNSELKLSYSVKHNDGIIKNYKIDSEKAPIKIINSWLYVNIRNIFILKLFRRNNTIFMSYEDFTSNPSKYLKIIYKSINLDFYDSILNLGENENHILGGNASRINAKEVKKQDEAWRTNLNYKMLRIFNYRAGWLNKILGYK
jgi:hypothetical protein